MVPFGGLQYSVPCRAVRRILVYDLRLRFEKRRYRPVGMVASGGGGGGDGGGDGGGGGGGGGWACTWWMGVYMVLTLQIVCRL